MKLIFWSLKYPDDELEIYKAMNRGHLQMAPHTFQKHLIEGFMATGACDLTVVSVPPMGSFPMQNKALFVKEKVIPNYGCQIGYLNLPVIKKRIIQKHIQNYTTEILQGDIEHDTWILLYSLYEPFVRAAVALKKKFPWVKICLLQTDCTPGRGDMPKYMTPSRIRYGNWAVAQAKYFDAFVVLTKYLAETLEVGEHPYLVMEGLVPATPETVPASVVPKNTDHRPIFLYTGSLDVAYGLDTLSRAFGMTDKAELWICGDGDFKAELLRLIKENPRENIHYLGFFSQAELAKVRAQSDFLINPRRPTGTYTKYSFPSKTMEYLLSGIPTVMCRLEGIPEEYDAYLNYMSTGDASEVKDYIEVLTVMDYETLMDKALRGKNFVEKEKNALSQAQKILNLMSES